MIKSFDGTFRWLSNFWPAEVVFEGVKYLSVEHAYVAAKTLDLNLRQEIKDIPKANKVKLFGRKMKIREDWTDQLRLEIMEDLVRQKFSNNKDLKELLLLTDNEEIVEGNHWHDLFFGKCSCEKHGGEGQNNLGKIIMKIRQELKENNT